ncbi:MAG: acyl-CoA synthetase (AMP-forming)/AMP-acid ligase II [Glaciecola sp.]|jgi:long-chain acyl-CoA synthetase
MQLQNQDIFINQASAKAVINEVTKLTARDSAFEVVTKQRDGVTYPAFVSLPTSLGDMYHAAAEAHGSAEFLVYLNERYSFAKLHELATAFSHVLSQECGIGKGDKVIIAMRNYPEWIVSFMGITILGAIAVPVNAWWSEQELARVITHSQASLVIVDDKRFAKLEDILQRLKVACLIARPSQDQNQSLCLMNKIRQFVATSVELIKNPRSVQQHEHKVDSNDIATIFYTSGSTGTPKGAMSTHESVLTALYTWLMLGSAAGIANKAADVEPAFAPAALMAVPLFHVTGCHTLFLLSMLIGRKTVMMPYWDAGLALKLIEQERVTYFNGVPTMSMELMNHPDKDNHNLDSLLDICAGGAARAPEHVRKISLLFNSGNPTCGYGLTETNALGAVNGPLEYLAKPTSAGLPTPPIVDVKIFNLENQPLVQGEIGEIAIKSISNIIGYWQDPKATLAAFSNGYFKTGDLGYLDEDGFIYIVDRIKDIIIRGGENISSLEVENALYEHPSTLEASVFGIPDERLGEVVGAVVCVNNSESVDEQSLQLFLAESIAHFKVPHKIWLVAQRLPRLGSGKIDKRAIKIHYLSLT